MDLSTWARIAVDHMVTCVRCTIGVWKMRFRGFSERCDWNENDRSMLVVRVVTKNIYVFMLNRLFRSITKHYLEYTTVFSLDLRLF